MAEITTMESLLKASFWNQMQKVHTAIPCIVLEVQNELKEQRVTVQPCIDILNEDGTTQRRSPMVNVPLIFPSSSTSALTFPVSKNDKVVCLFSMRAMEVFSETNGQPAPPNNFAKFNQKDAMAIPGLFPRQDSINNPSKRTNPHDTKDTVLVHNIGTSSEVEIRLKPSGDLIINSPAMVQINCQTAEVNAESSASVTTPQLTVDADSTTWNGDIELNGNLNQSGTHTLDGVNMNTHYHNQPNDSRGDTEMPTGGPQ